MPLFQSGGLRHEWKMFWWKWYKSVPELPIIQEVTEVVGNMRILEDQLRKDLN